jgi:hypothetical protein
MLYMLLWWLWPLPLQQQELSTAWDKLKILFHKISNRMGVQIATHRIIWTTYILTNCQFSVNIWIRCHDFDCTTSNGNNWELLKSTWALLKSAWEHGGAQRSSTVPNPWGGNYRLPHHSYCDISLAPSTRIFFYEKFSVNSDRKIDLLLQKKASPALSNLLMPTMRARCSGQLREMTEMFFTKSQITRECNRRQRKSWQTSYNWDNGKYDFIQSQIERKHYRQSHKKFIENIISCKLLFVWLTTRTGNSTFSHC